MSHFALMLHDHELNAAQVEQVRALLPEGMELLHTTDQDEVLAHADSVEIVAGWMKPPTVLALPKLRWVQQWYAGGDWLFRHPEAADAPFMLTNVAGIHAVPISEHVLGMMLHFGRNFPNAIAAKEQRVWARVKHASEPIDKAALQFTTGDLYELADKTILIMGVGAIGERIAKLAQAFDMRVIGIRNNPSKGSKFVDEMLGMEQLDYGLSSADFVINALPFTPKTDKLYNAERFAQMKSSAVFINIGRGKSVDEDALIAALHDGTIAAAGIDVTATEPLPDDSGLWELPNLLMTSHYSGSSSRYHERAFEILLDNIERYKKGEPLRNLMDKRGGY